MRRPAFGAFAFFAVTSVMFTACDPCAGVASCTGGSAQLNVTGQIIDRASGLGAANVEIVVTPSDNRLPPVSTTTDADGLWRAHAETSGDELGDSVRIDVLVRSSGTGGYTVRRLAVRTTTAADAVHLGQWTTVPSARAVVGFQYLGAPLANATVRFVRTGGVPVSTAPVLGGTDASGNVELDVDGPEVGAVVGTIELLNGGLPRPVRIVGLRIDIGYQYGIPRPIATLIVGGTYARSAQAVFRGTGLPEPGARIMFVRTGGARVSPDTLNVTADSAGRFLLAFTSDEEGTLVGDLTISAAALSTKSTIRNLRFSTFDSPLVRDIGPVRFGEQWAGVFTIIRHDLLVPAPDLRVVFRRTGGLSISPAIFDVHTDAEGRIELRAAVRDTGVVEGELTVFPSNASARVISGVRLRTAERDDPVDAGIYGFGPALRYYVEVLRADGSPVSGAVVDWTQTSGPPAAPATLSSTTNSVGRALTVLTPSTDGDVVGTIRIRPGAPWPLNTEFVFAGQHFPSFEAGDLRLGATFRLPAP